MASVLALAVTQNCAAAADRAATIAIIMNGSDVALGLYRIIANDVALPDQLRAVHPESHGAALERASIMYQHHLEEDMAGVRIVGGASGVVSTGLAWASASGAGTVPALLGKASWDYATVTLLGKWEKDIRSDVTGALASDIQAWQTKENKTLADLRAMSPEEQVSALVAQQGALRQLRDRLKDDPHATTVTNEATFAQLGKMDETLLEGHAQQQIDIERIAGQVTQYAQSLNRLDRRTSALETSVKNLDGRVGTLEKAVGSLQQDVADNRIATTAVASVLFDSSSAAHKRQLIEANALGPMSEEQKSNLLAVVDAQEKRENFVNTANDIAQGTTLMLGVADTLGIPLSDDFKKGASVVIAGSNAAAAFATGNYVGAVMQLSGIFGNKSSPEEALSKQLSAINAKLDRVLENQYKILSSLQTISVQIEDLRKTMNARFKRVEYQLEVINWGVTNLQLKEFAPCQLAWEKAWPEAEGPKARDTLAPIGHFRRWDDLYAFHNRAGKSAQKCSAEIQEAVSLLKGDQGSVFALTTLASALDKVQLSSLRLDRLEGEPLSESELEQTADYFERLEDFTRPWRESQFGSGRAAYVAYINPMLTLDEAIATHRAQRGAAPKSFQPVDRVASLIADADGAGASENRVRGLLSSPLNSRLVLDAARWTTVAAPYLDWADGGEFLTISEMLCEGKTGNALSKCSAKLPRDGRDLVNSALTLVDAAIAEINHTMGPSTAILMAMSLRGDALDREHAYQLLKQNRYLAANTSRVLMWCSGATALSECGTSRVGRTGYEFALRHVLDKSPLATESMSTLFGEDVTIATDADPTNKQAIYAVAQLTLQAPLPHTPMWLPDVGRESIPPATDTFSPWPRWEDPIPPEIAKLFGKSDPPEPDLIVTNLPMPGEFGAKMFSFPPIFFQLSAARAQLAIMLSDYDALRCLSPKERTSVLVEMHRQAQGRAFEVASSSNSPQQARGVMP